MPQRACGAGILRRGSPLSGVPWGNTLSDGESRSCTQGPLACGLPLCFGGIRLSGGNMCGPVPSVQATPRSPQPPEHEVTESREPTRGARAKKYMEMERQAIKQKKEERCGTERREKAGEANGSSVGGSWQGASSFPNQSFN